MMTAVMASARAAVLQLWDGTRLRTLASQGAWSKETLFPPDLYHDRTAYQALERKRPMRATEIDGVSQKDSDLAAPILDPSGEVLGVLAVRGIPYAALSGVILHELSIIAQWSAKPIAELPTSGSSSALDRVKRGAT